MREIIGRQTITVGIVAEIPRPRQAEPRLPRLNVRDYALLLKPRVMSLVVFTALVGLLLAPGAIGTLSATIAVICIAVGGGAAGAINMWYDRDIDLIMTRTRNRPLPAKRLRPERALAFGITLAVLSVAVMAWAVNPAAAGLLAFTIFYYVFVYTVWLKRRTPQNIVIGGAAGAFPPMIGWIAVSGGLEPNSIILFLIIFLWTPPHTWALALFRSDDYERAGVPMMPVVVGAHKTKIQMLIYSIALVLASLLPTLVGMSGRVYGVAALAIAFAFMGVMFVAIAVVLIRWNPRRCTVNCCSATEAGKSPDDGSAPVNVNTWAATDSIV